MGCASLSLGVQATCAGVKKVGGINKRIWLGLLEDLASVTYGTGNIVTGFTFKTDKGLVVYDGRKEKNSSGVELEVGENLNFRNQSLIMLVYTETAAQLTTLDQLLDTEQLFAVVEPNSGPLEVYGLNLTDYAGYGLKATAYTRNSGVVLNDSSAHTVTLSGAHTNLELHYAPAVAKATNIAALMALSIDPVTVP
jgi:hypothetical protein